MTRNYLVTVACAATEPSNLMGATDLPGGVTIELEDSKFLMHIPVQAESARTALTAARDLAEDYCRVLASTYSPFRIDHQDPRDKITRSDATPITDGPIPPLDVAEGHLDETGQADRLDPDGTARREGKVFRLRASGVATRLIDECAAGFAQRSGWPPRLKNALSLYWAAQCSPDRQVRFVLAMAALEVLAQAPTRTLLQARLTPSARRDLTAEMNEVLARYLQPDEVGRLLNRISETRVESNIPTLVDYLNARIPPDSEAYGGQVTPGEVKTWVSQRGGFLHNGPHDPSAEAARHRLDALVGMMLRWELNQR